MIRDLNSFSISIDVLFLLSTQQESVFTEMNVTFEGEDFIVTSFFERRKNGFYFKFKEQSLKYENY